MQTQLARWLFLFLVSLTFLLSILFWTTNLLFIFIGAFSILYWQRERVRSLLWPLVAGRSLLMSFMMLGILWAFFFEITLLRTNIYSNPLVSFIAAFGFYLPYFLVWYKIFQFQSLSLMRVFYLAGVSGFLFQLLITKNIATVLTQAPNVPTGLLFLTFKISAVIVFSGALTTFPFIALDKKEKEYQPKVTTQLLGLASYFIALVVYLIWIGAIKRLVI